LAHRISWLPSITGFMAVRFVFGPSGINILSQETMANSGILINIALGLILYRLGLYLHIVTLRQTPGLLLISLVESVATFCLVTYALSIFDVEIVTAALVAAITVSSSPAVLCWFTMDDNDFSAPIPTDRVTPCRTYFWVVSAFRRYQYPPGGSVPTCACDRHNHVGDRSGE